MFVCVLFFYFYYYYSSICFIFLRGDIINQDHQDRDQEEEQIADASKVSSIYFVFLNPSNVRVWHELPLRLSTLTALAG